MHARTLLGLLIAALTALAEKGTPDRFEAYGFVNAQKRAILDEAQDLESEHINIIYGNAGSDIPTANILMKDAINSGADTLLTLSTLPASRTTTSPAPRPVCP